MENLSRFRTFLHKNKGTIGLLILCITLIWGYAWILMKEALNYMGPFTFSAFRFGTGTLTMLVVLSVMKIGLPPKDKWGHLLVAGILQTSIVFLFVMYGLRFVDAGKSSVLLYSMPIWSSLLATKFLQERIPRMKMIGLGIGLLGLLTILGWDIWMNQNSRIIFGELLIVVAAISWGASNVYYRLKLLDVSQLQVNTYQMLFGTLGIIIASFMVEGGDPVHLTGESIYYVLFTGVLASALCFTVWFFLLSIIDMVTATISTLLVPVFGMFFGWLLLDEHLTPSIIIGSFLILIGIFIANIAKKKA
ncbi:Permease of the drug/metabolite transporter (DMT) superfamily [Salinibacillus kushneri]|uniref:Permease of the drug/metabolite transporter (DMT) superfamily n=1 Tax=Salinibacillus kushneri TaxID=237682 RepID=A0A1I0IFJ5_9BACI|nr:DMT family transporter [Salinibacillus kushneri]SET95791.1 Permease of the drug/metabolite transporter (DMT) superfamily [Salinibacillus kushneri]